MSEIEPQDVPQLVGRCLNQIAADEICNTRIFDNEDYIVTLTKVLLCAGCVDRLLSPKTSKDDPDEDGEVKRGGARWRGKRTRRSAPSTYGEVRTRAA